VGHVDDDLPCEALANFDQMAFAAGATAVPHGRERRRIFRARNTQAMPHSSAPGRGDRTAVYVGTYYLRWCRRKSTAIRTYARAIWRMRTRALNCASFTVCSLNAVYPGHVPGMVCRISGVGAVRRRATGGSASGCTCRRGEPYLQHFHV
jgi:hypothetical protein